MMGSTEKLALWGDTLFMRPLRSRLAKSSKRFAGTPRGDSFDYQDIGNYVDRVPLDSIQLDIATVLQEQNASLTSLSAADAERLDETDDALFYSRPRLMYHTDEAFRLKTSGEKSPNLPTFSSLCCFIVFIRLAALYEEHLQRQNKVLDLCSSRYSHIPSSLLPLTVVGHGMNETELQANEQLSSYFVQDLNQQPQLLGLASECFHAVLCCCGIQYLNKPYIVLREVCQHQS